jgi:hypothetical protein
MKTIPRDLFYVEDGSCDPFSHILEKLTKSDWKGGRWAPVGGEAMGAVEEGDNSGSAVSCADGST